MIYLFIVSLIWAFSFGLIKGSLTGIDSNLVSFIRLSVSLVAFLPFLKIRNIKKNIILKLMLTGAVQYGIMYSFYIYSYNFLKAYEVALFTIFTPLFVTFFNDVFERKFNRTFFIASVAAIAGTAIVVYTEFDFQKVLKGFLIVQASNICFAFGQIYYRRIMKDIEGVKDYNIFGFVYAGAALITGLFTLFMTDFSMVAINSQQLYILIYLGAVASGFAFFLWNFGARKTDAGALAVFNNLKIPLAITVSLLFFGESTDILKLIAGLLIILAGLLFNEYKLGFSFRKKTL